MYGVTEKKITHIIQVDKVDGLGYRTTDCGKWIKPKRITEKKPEGCRMCKQCAKCGEVKEIVCTVDGKLWCEDCFDKAMGWEAEHEAD